MTIPKLTINNKTLKFPIIQGGMGIKISLSRLAKASIKSGIAGVISSAQIGFSNIHFKKNPFKANTTELVNEISKVREECPDGLLGVNLMYASNDFGKYADFLGKQDIDFIVSGAGLPMDLPKYLTESKVKPAVIISSGRAAKIILRNWDRKYNTIPEFIVVEGPLAGGHLGFTKEDFENNKVKSLEELVLEVKKEVNVFEEKYQKKIPVIAAGGIHDGKDISRFINLGCDGVQIATRFIATHECDVSDEYKQKILDAKEEDIVRVASPAGLPGRAVKNNLTETIKTKNIPVKYCVDCLRTCNKVDIPYCITDRLGQSAAGDSENGLIFTGAKAYLINKIQSVESLVKELMLDFQKAQNGFKEA